MKVAILGYGKSGQSAEKLLRKYYQINEIVIYDDRLDEYESLINFNDALFDMVVVSPGLDTKSLQINEKKIVSEYELAINLIRDKKIIGITGSNGKSTTTYLTAQLMNRAGIKSVACGNIGFPLGEAIQDDYDVYVVEFSSFQIDLMRNGEYLDAGVITNITPDHLDRYGLLENYINSKLRLRKLLKCDGELITGSSVAEMMDETEEIIIIDETLEQYPKKDGNILNFRNFYVDLSKFSLIGSHNIINLSFALSLANVFLDLNGDCTHLIENLRGLPHRCEYLGEKNGIIFINDSKATNVDSTFTALKGITRPVVLLLGGKDKGGDFSKLTEVIQNKCRYVICFGEHGLKIYDQLANVRDKILVKNLFNAVERAAEIAKKGDVVLLSPGCASFDEFQNFEHRGDYFKELVEKL
ncbi:UDP-N-acetylmuramoyl-L-alanine--D-glutamate ligase [Deferribacter autotrophicus]|uniref:UDP-N-acetylmuramoylalanine--D-glutamate ligase n=1 Tax=Deferribacter autotrophicus TaxID=500465 RepID=A0A5A8F2Z4_9BACT|nr:UDP-N-acetylmuramoyl-L-alanine--D-glutamate ligase [Deferribacter autotrophicus]KAA0257859.1 UDP-N-acetylmuramoyl-L-alanine--D-glutamate ligase [Deferribacter autotrophicus]